MFAQPSSSWMTSMSEDSVTSSAGVAWSGDFFSPSGVRIGVTVATFSSAGGASSTDLRVRRGRGAGETGAGSLTLRDDLGVLAVRIAQRFDQCDDLRLYSLASLSLDVPGESLVALGHPECVDVERHDASFLVVV
jgi:hypothetical protein